MIYRIENVAYNDHFYDLIISPWSGGYNGGATAPPCQEVLVYYTCTHLAARIFFPLFTLLICAK